MVNDTNTASFNNSIFTVLLKIFQQHGESIYEDGNKLEALLKDLAPQSKKEIRLISISLESGLVEAIFNNYISGSINEIILEKFKQILMVNYPISIEASEWIIELWKTLLYSLKNPDKRKHEFVFMPSKLKTEGMLEKQNLVIKELEKELNQENTTKQYLAIENADLSRNCLYLQNELEKKGEEIDCLWNSNELLNKSLAQKDYYVSRLRFLSVIIVCLLILFLIFFYYLYTEYNRYKKAYYSGANSESTYFETSTKQQFNNIQL